MIPFFCKKKGQDKAAGARKQRGSIGGGEGGATASPLILAGGDCNTEDHPI